MMSPPARTEGRVRRRRCDYGSVKASERDLELLSLIGEQYAVTLPQIACLMLTSFSDDEALFDAIMAGAAGYILKEVRGSDLIGDIRKVASGQSLLDPSLTGRVMERLRRREISDDAARLTPQNSGSWT